jgi:diguanylate cyclase (GGDEF)-like protein
MSDEDLMSFVGEGEGTSPVPAPVDKPAVWRILITDDEQDVHSATAFALRNTKILGRRLEFLHANSAEEALNILKTEDDIAVILLDVVMETPNAGLDLVAVIRQELDNHEARIILRTGQPNQAPEIEVIRDYDINDYKLKSELTQNKLYAALTTAVRSFQQIKTIEAGKLGLKKIVEASAELMSKEGLHEFAEGVILQLSALLSVPPEGLICVRRNNSHEEKSIDIIAAAGHYCTLIDHPLSDMNEENAKKLLIESLDNRCNVYGKTGIALFLGSRERSDTSCYVASVQNIRDVDRDLLEMFVSNITVCADNLSLIEDLKNYAYVDALTSLPNRNALNEKLVKLDADQAKASVLVLMDIDSFAELTASLTQEQSDEFIQLIANRLSETVPESCVVARLDGDTFALLGNSEDISPELMASMFEQAFSIGEQNKKVVVTAGIMPLQAIEGDEKNALKYAGAVLKQAKIENRGSVVTYQWSAD